MKYSFSQYLLRAIAYTFDCTITILTIFVPFVILYFVDLVLSLSKSFNFLFVIGVIITTLVGLIFGFGYFLLKDGIKGGSLGKRLVGLKVIHIDSKEDCTFLQSFVRNLFFMMIGSIDALVPFFTANGQKASDIIAKTVVVKK